MAVVRVPLSGSSGKSVSIERNSTVGAEIGIDFRLPDTTVPTLAQLAEILALEASDTINEIVKTEISNPATVSVTIPEVAARTFGGM